MYRIITMKYLYGLYTVHAPVSCYVTSSVSSTNQYDHCYIFYVEMDITSLRCYIFYEYY
jgi:hypothetical protein